MWIQRLLMSPNGRQNELPRRLPRRFITALYTTMKPLVTEIFASAYLFISYHFDKRLLLIERHNLIGTYTEKNIDYNWL